MNNKGVVMKNRMSLSLFGLLIIPLTLIGCKSKTNIMQTVTKEIAGAKQQQDSLCFFEYSVLNTSKNVNVFRLNPGVKPTPDDNSIANFVVIDKGKALNNKQVEVLKFLVSSPLSYKAKYGINKKYFVPYFAFEFSNSKETLYLLVDISADEWAIADKTKVLKHRYTNSRLPLIQLGYDIFPEDEFIQSIINNIKDYEK